MNWHTLVTELVTTAALIVEVAGVGAILLGIAIATGDWLWRLSRAESRPDAYRRYRANLGRGILLGLELLVAADIIRTVATEPTLNGVLVLGLIVVIRTFLAWSIQLEIEGRWPWQRRSIDAPPSDSAPPPA